MEINKNTIQNLYRGLGYEYYTASKLWQMGLEAYKMDADFGFDIFAFNQREKTFNEALEKKYLFQIKTRIITEFKNENTTAGLRKTATTEFFIKKEQFEWLLKEPNAILVCYLVDGSEAGKRKYLAEFWLDNNYLTYLNNNNYFLENKEEKKIIFKVRYQSIATLKDELTSKLSELIIKTDTSEYKEICNELQTIKSLIKKSSIENENSNINFYLISEDNREEFIKEKHKFFENCIK